MLNFLHKLFNPHCTHCLAELEAERERERLNRIDPTVEVLRLELDKAQRINERLLNSVTERPVPVFTEPVSTAPRTPLATRPTWSAERARLESESRARAAELLKSKDPVTESLESMIGIPEVKKENNG